MEAQQQKCIDAVVYVAIVLLLFFGWMCKVIKNKMDNQKIYHDLLEHRVYQLERQFVVIPKKLEDIERRQRFK
jgi:hypothetical protein